MKKLILLVAVVASLTMSCEAGITLRVWNSELMVEIVGYKTDGKNIQCDEMKILLPTGYALLDTKQKNRLVTVLYRRNNGSTGSTVINLDELKVDRDGQPRTYIFHPKKPVEVEVIPGNRPQPRTEGTVPA